MKPIKFLFATMIAVLALVTLPSCSDNNEDEPAVPAAKAIAGTYAGDMECSVMGSASTFENLSFVLSATDDATVTVTLPAFGEAPMAMPSITITGVKVTEANGISTLATTEYSGQTDSGKSYTCTVSGSVSDKTLDIKFNLQYGAMPMPMICSSTATKQ